MRSRALALILISSCVAAAPTVEGEDRQAVDDPRISQAEQLIAEGRFVEAEAEARAALARMEAAHGARSMPATQAASALASALFSQKRWGDPELRSLVERNLEIRRELFGPRSLAVASALDDLGKVIAYAGDARAGLPFAEEALAIKQELLPADDPSLVHAKQGVAWLRARTGDMASSLGLLGEVVDSLRRIHEPGHPDIGAALTMLADVMYEAGDVRGAHPIVEEALRIRRAALGPWHPDVAETLSLLANCLTVEGRLAEARDLFAEALDILRAALPGSPSVGSAAGALSGALLRLGDTEAALLYSTESVEILTASLGEPHPATASALDGHAQILMLLDRFDEAAAALERSLEITRATLGEKHPEMTISLSNLGGSWSVRLDPSRLDSRTVPDPTAPRPRPSWGRTGPAGRDPRGSRPPCA